MSNFIKVSDKYAIASDSRQWMVQKSAPVKDKETGETSVQWASFSYHGSLPQAVKALGEHLHRTGGSSTYTELVESANKISLLLGQSFTASAEVSIKEAG